MAPPGCAADRHVKKELTKQIRGISDLERQAEHSPSQDAQVVADYGLAIRTGMRDDGTYPLAPPGVQRSQQLPLMAASVERVMAAQPAALLTRLSRMLSVGTGFPKAFAQRVILFSWIHQSAHLLKAPTSFEAAQSPRLTCGHELTQRGLPTELLRGVTSIEKITIAFAPQLFEYVKQPLLPRTTHDLDLFSGRLKKSRRPITGRTHTQALLLREGRLVALRFGLPETNHWVDAFARLNANDCHPILHRLRQTEKRRKCWHTRRDLGAYLPALEQPWGLHQ